MSAKISAAPNVGNTCYLLQALYTLFLIGGWKERESEASNEDSKTGKLALRLLRSMEHLSEDETSPSKLVRELASSLFLSKWQQQQDVLETVMLLLGNLHGTLIHEFQTQTWSTCACGLASEKRPETQNMFVVSTDEPAANLQDLVNTVLQCNNDGWKCPSKECSRKQETTSLSTTSWYGERILVFIKRPFDQPRTDVHIPMTISMATYEAGKISANMVDGYIQYVVMHSTDGGNVPDAWHPDSVSNAQTGHYFGCESKSPPPNSSHTGCIVDCLAKIPNEMCDIKMWVEARGRKVVSVLYTTEKPSWMVVVPFPFVCLYVCVCMCGCGCGCG